MHYHQHRAMGSYPLVNRVPSISYAKWKAQFLLVKIIFKMYHDYDTGFIYSSKNLGIRILFWLASLINGLRSLRKKTAWERSCKKPFSVQISLLMTDFTFKFMNVKNCLNSPGATWHSKYSLKSSIIPLEIKKCAYC